MKKIELVWVILLLLHPFCLFAETPTVLSILDDFPHSLSEDHHPLAYLEGQSVRVRGFWYPISEEQGILAATPNLKSCCIGSPVHLHQQLIVEGKLSSLSPQRVVTLEGIFRIDPTYDENGQTKQMYRLEQAREARRENFSLLFIMLGLILLVGILYPNLRAFVLNAFKLAS